MMKLQLCSLIVSGINCRSCCLGLSLCPTGAGVSTNKLCNVIALQESCVFVDIFAFRYVSVDRRLSAFDVCKFVRAGKLSVLQWLVSSPDELPVCRPSDDVAFVIKTGMQLRSRLCFAIFFCRVSCLQPVTSDVNKTKFLRPRPEQQDQDQSDKTQDRAFLPRLFVRYTYCSSSKQFQFSIYKNLAIANR